MIGRQILWKAKMYSIGLGGFLMVAAAAFVAVIGFSRRILLIGSGLQFVAFGAWWITHDDFRYVIYDYAVAMLLTLVLFCRASYGRVSGSLPWIAGSILLALVGSALQASSFDLHPNFNQNDAFHMIQIGHGWPLYRGFSNSKDRIE